MDRPRRLTPASLLPALLAAAPLLGCLWDRDTVDDEIRGVPETWALVTGRWWQHDDSFYRWRVDTLMPQLRDDGASLPLFDDVAVALERLGRRDEALAILERKEQVLRGHPDRDHQYRLHANRGTVYAHLERRDEAVAELEKAIAINPDAHFGREKYQVMVNRYVGAARRDPTLWARESALSLAGEEQRWLTPASYTAEGREIRSGRTRGDPAHGAAISGLAGMVRFGGRQGPELFRCLGDEFAAKGDLNLAWICYQRALEGGHPAPLPIAASIAAIEKHWNDADMPQVPTREWYGRMRAANEAWLAAFRCCERLRVRRGEDCGDPAVIAALAAEADAVVPEPPRPPATFRWQRFLWQAAGVAVPALLAALVGLLALTLYRRWRARRQA